MPERRSSCPLDLIALVAAACGNALLDPFLNLARNPSSSALRYFDGVGKSVLANELINRAAGKARGFEADGGRRRALCQAGLAKFGFRPCSPARENYL